ncbi:MAG TPA: BON domain-containing protein [Casimicrobiaceae bacterium]|nr:BON domain-containing protein [Casimicrobiaceae bacterium]
MTSSINDSELRRTVIAELEWDPSVDASSIAVAVKEGVVTLAGSVRTYAEKLNAERAVKHLSGVRGIADDIEVRLDGSNVRGDADIAQSVLSALRFNVAVPNDCLRVTVDRGWVRLEGEVEWQYQRAAAEASVRPVMGVKGVTNDIIIKPQVKAADVKAEIEDAFARRARVDADKITVDATGDTVTLRGSVRTWTAKDEAEQAAWYAPGVAKVHNDIVVNP